MIAAAKTKLESTDDEKELRITPTTCTVVVVIVVLVVLVVLIFQSGMKMLQVAVVISCGRKPILSNGEIQPRIVLNSTIGSLSKLTISHVGSDCHLASLFFKWICKNATHHKQMLEKVSRPRRARISFRLCQVVERRLESQQTFQEKGGSYRYQGHYTSREPEPEYRSFYAQGSRATMSLHFC